MEDRSMILRRASLQMLGHMLMDSSFPFEEYMEGEETEKEAKDAVEDILRLALQAGDTEREERIREVVETAWNKGRMVGFMVGMQAGARVVLALVGEGEIRI